MLEIDRIKNKLNYESSLLNKQIEEHNEYFKKRERFQELDKMERNLVELSKKKWLNELLENELISKLDYENIIKHL